ncbi:TerB family tellurite resistance protein [Acidisoma silvae]|uniref:TerB family tellurite resistance protein n=1 Tax=Acidisoma silvae TaxID=2802396 RepID=A0A964DZR7_9PROT|nr:TerB family tellurite resistance protein [Acidisoma silvae]MCB8876586.1 TerB family tellurite resistance protein [Acidisoma silvae]
MLWGKIIGGVAGFAVGGPAGAIMGAALGHAADAGAIPQIQKTLRGFNGGRFGASSAPLNSARLAAMLGQRDQLFAIAAVSLSAKLAKCDGPVNRAEIDAFKRAFHIPPQNVPLVGRLFDEARSSPQGFEPFAEELALAFDDNRVVLDEVLRSLFVIARADGPVNAAETRFLKEVHQLLRLDRFAWDQAMNNQSRAARGSDEGDAYAELGLTRAATNEELREARKKLMRENHPDSLASRGVPPEFVARATERAARVNAAWDRIKRERGL